MSDPETGVATSLDAAGLAAAGLAGMAARPGRRGRPGTSGQAAPAGPRGARSRRARARQAGQGGGRLAQVPYVIVLCGVLAGLALIWQGTQYVRPGTLTVAGALFLAALARLTLPGPRAGMLANRRRYIDVTALAILAVGLLVAGLVLPIPW